MLVTNSRLGPFGFLGGEELRTRSDDGSTGGYGLQDQRLALEWVRDNIEAFGGNASNVVIMGESSGGTSVGAHLVMPQSWGLFHKAILESPGLTQVKAMSDSEMNYKYMRDALLAHKSPGCIRDTVKRYTTYTDAYLNGRHHLGVASTGTIRMRRPPAIRFQPVRALRCYTRRAAAYSPAHTQVTLHQEPEILGAGYLHLSHGENATSYLKAAAPGAGCLLTANASLITNLAQFLPRGDTFETDAWAPAVDGKQLPDAIIPRIANGQVAKVPILAGSNMDEGTIFMGLTPRLTCEATEKQLAEWAIAFYGEEIGENIPALYAQLRQPVPLCVHMEKDGEARSVEEADLAASPPPPAHHSFMAAMRSAGDYAITCRVRSAATSFATLKSGPMPVYTYYFTHTPKYSANYHNLPTLRRLPRLRSALCLWRCVRARHRSGEDSRQDDGLLLAQFCAYGRSEWPAV